MFDVFAGSLSSVTSHPCALTAARTLWSRAELRAQCLDFLFLKKYPATHATRMTEVGSDMRRANAQPPSATACRLYRRHSVAARRVSVCCVCCSPFRHRFAIPSPVRRPVGPWRLTFYAQRGRTPYTTTYNDATKSKNLVHEMDHVSIQHT